MGEVERRAQGAGTGAERRHGRRAQARAQDAGTGTGTGADKRQSGGDQCPIEIGDSVPSKTD